jgi:hypothetical protein
MFNILLPKIHLEVEKWKFNKNYRLYVSNLGNFKDKTKETINLKVSAGGYLQVPVCNNKQGIIKYIPAHRIVMETWCPRVNMWKDKLTVDHLDHNKRNNSYKNLEWVSLDENQRRATNDFIRLDIETENQKLKSQIEKLMQEKNEEISSINKEYNNIENDFFIRAGQYSFNNFTAAAHWIIKKQGMHSNTNINEIKKNIYHSIKNQTKYCKYTWQLSFKNKGGNK